MQYFLQVADCFQLIDRLTDFQKGAILRAMYASCELAIKKSGVLEQRSYINWPSNQKAYQNKAN